MENLEGKCLTVQGIKVHFPVKPYPSQISMMAKIIKGLTNRMNCLLESPTGTGKSLALLCSVLAWQKTIAEKREKEILEMEDANEDDDTFEKGTCCTCGKVKKKDICDDISNKSSKASLEIQEKDESIKVPCPTKTKPVNDDDDDDFKPASSVYKTPLNRQSIKRNRLSIEYETEPNINEKANEKEADTCTCYEFKQKKEITRIPTIYYATRTHRQIKQITKEMARTRYGSTRMTILSSRQHSCIHPSVSRQKNKNEGCSELLDDSGCCFNDNAKKVSHSSLRKHGLEIAWDLEDLVSVCRTLKACPYFGSRMLKDQAEIIFCPYNYLIDASIRESMQLELKDHIVILDEAHNIEDSAREAASNIVTQKQIQQINEQLEAMVASDVNSEHCFPILALLKKIYNFIETKGSTLRSKGFEQPSTILTGKDMVLILETFGLNAASLSILKTHFIKICEDSKKGDDESDEDETFSWRKKKQRSKRKLSLPHGSQQVIQSLFIVLDFLFRENKKFVNDYRVAVVRTTTYNETRRTSNRWFEKGVKNTEASYTFTLNFWCLSPAVAFSDFAAARCVILTSGTLAPIQSFQSELGLPLPLQLEASHVIHNSQVWVGSIAQGPKGDALLTTYKNTEQFSYQDEVGRLMLEICKIIPYGVLCFLPSYKLLEKLSDRWKTTGLWYELFEQKEVMCEPRASDNVDFDEMIANYYSVIEMAVNSESGSKPDGALLLAVCRGKISEGIDFAHNNARAVVTIGIPFPNFMDVQVNLKKEYNNQNQYRGLLSGNEWYEIQAYRALNQALGRCIRNRTDWGALILVDSRFGSQPDRYMRGISKWVRTKAMHFRNFGCARSSLMSFTEQRTKAESEGKKLRLSLSPNSSILQDTPSKPEFGFSQVDTPHSKPLKHFSTPYADSLTSPASNGLTAKTPLDNNKLKVVQVHTLELRNVTCEGGRVKYDIQTSKGAYNVVHDIGQDYNLIEVPIEPENFKLQIQVRLASDGTPELKIVSVEAIKIVSPPMSKTLDSKSCFLTEDKNSGSCDGNSTNLKSDGSEVRHSISSEKNPQNMQMAKSDEEKLELKKEGIFQFVDLVTPNTKDKKSDENVLNSPTLFDSESNDSTTFSKETAKLKLDFDAADSDLIEIKNSSPNGNKENNGLKLNKQVSEEGSDLGELNIKRRGRKRKLSTKGRGIKKSKEVTDLPENNVLLSCGVCLNSIQFKKGQGPQKLTNVPEFLCDMEKKLPQLSVDDEVYLVNEIDDIAGVVTYKQDKEIYNSFWSEKFRCCMKLLQCEECCNIIAAELLSVNTPLCFGTVGQIFLFGSAVKVTS